MVGRIRICRRVPVPGAWMVAFTEFFFLSSEESPGQSGVHTMHRVETGVYPVR